MYFHLNLESNKEFRIGAGTHTPLGMSLVDSIIIVYKIYNIIGVLLNFYILSQKLYIY